MECMFCLVVWCTEPIDLAYDDVIPVVHDASRAHFQKQHALPLKILIYMIMLAIYNNVKINVCMAHGMYSYMYMFIVSFTTS